MTRGRDARANGRQCVTCGESLAGRATKYCATHQPNPFDPTHAPYGSYEGVAGDASQWREAFQHRFTDAEVAQYLGDRSPWAVLGLRSGASPDEIKRAYRLRARGTHPDLHPGIDRAEFQRVQAAYQQLGGGV